MKPLLYVAILETLGARSGSWFSQEQVAHQTGSDAKTAQATLSRLVANDYVERIRPRKVENAPSTIGRFLYRVKFPVDASKVSIDATKRLTSRRGTIRQGALQLPLVPVEEHQRRRGRA